MHTLVGMCHMRAAVVNIAQHGTMIMLCCHIYNYMKRLVHQMAGEGGQIHMMDNNLSMLLLSICSCCLAAVNTAAQVQG